MAASRKRVFETVDGTPEKRLFLSIISDYDLRTGICELIDNALDLWTSNGRAQSLSIDVTLDVERQIIQVVDDAGGVNEKDLRLLIAPGASRNATGDELIGIFGVGGKRAAVALGEHVEIRTRQGTGRSLQIEITNDWLGIDDWAIDAYEVAEIRPNSTVVDISKVRQNFSSNDVEVIRRRLGETYSWFLSNGCSVRVNDQPISAVAFNAWAYPPGFEPRCAEFKIAPSGKNTLTVRITAGLIVDRDPVRENYGVYLYCNHRLIVKELRTRDVGYFVTGEAGVPHPDASLCRVLVELQGPAELMPWNSSKSGINFSHPAFVTIRPKIIGLTSYFSSLSRRLKNDWNEQVFPYPQGKMEPINAAEMLPGKKIVLPKLPPSRKPARMDVLRSKNKRVMDAKPWTVGLVEAMGMVDLVTRQNLESKNRIALILLDSNFEIGLKEFIVHRSDLFPPHSFSDAKIAALFKSRHQVIDEVKAHVTLSSALLDKVRHYYNLRNKLIHERASVGISDKQVEDYRGVVETVLRRLFKLQFPND